MNKLDTKFYQKLKTYNLTTIFIQLFVLGTVFVSVSCTEVIDMGYTTDFERLVVDGTLTDADTVQYVRLSKINLDNSDTIMSPVSGASVVLSYQDNQVVFKESDNEKGFYAAPAGFKGQQGVDYTLNITNTGVKGTDNTNTYSAEEVMMQSVDIDSLVAEYLNNPHMGIAGFVLRIWFQDSPDFNYYLCKAWKNGVLLTDTLYEFQKFNDDVFNGDYLNGLNCYLLDDNKQDEYVNKGDTVVLEFASINKSFFEYLNSAQKESFGSNPMFGGPPANVSTNVTNGAVGIFRVYSITRKTLIMEKAERDK